MIKLLYCYILLYLIYLLLICYYYCFIIKVYELTKQKVFKKLLYFFMPSKTIFSKLSWCPSNFIYCSVGNKVFSLLSSSSELIKILQQSPEDNIFTSNKSWYEDFVYCLEFYRKLYYLICLYNTLFQ